MKRNTDRILTTHVGSLVRPPGVVEIMRAKESGQAYNQEELASRVRISVREVVQKQTEAGVDILSDGEYGKPFFRIQAAMSRSRACSSRLKRASSASA